MFYGDSLTEGAWVKPDRIYSTVFARQALKEGLDWQVVNCGRNGDLIRVTETRLMTDLDREQPDVVCLCLGGNDYLEGRWNDKGGARLELERLVNIIQERNAIVIMVGQDPILDENIPRVLGMSVEFTKRFSFFNIHKEVADKYGLYYIKSIYGGLPPKNSIQLMIKFATGVNYFPRDMFSGKYFMDAVHPSGLGHGLIGCDLFGRISPLLKRIQVEGQR